MKPPDLINRLHTIRRMVRRRLVGYGLCATFAASVVVFMAALTCDWLLELPAVLRIAVAVTALAILFCSIIHWVIRPVRARLDIAEIAGRLEQHFGALEDRLSSTVNFVQMQPGHIAHSSVSMMQQVIANTDRAIRDIPLESALTLKPLVTRCVLLVISMVALASVLLASPGWARTGFYRYVYPFGEIEWPRSVSIEPLTGTQTVALGESVTLSMQVSRGMHDTLRGVVHLRDKQGDTVSLAMRRGDDGVFQTTVDTVTEDIDYWFEAGDANTEPSPFRIRVVRRVEVVEASATIEPPPYAPRRSRRTHDLNEGPVSAIIGSSVTIKVRASKSIPSDPKEQAAGLRLESQPANVSDVTAGPEQTLAAFREAETRNSAGDSGFFIPLQVDPEDPRWLSSQFELTSDIDFRIELRDQQGFTNRRAAVHTILAVPDRPPTVTIVEPRSVVEATPKASVDLVIQAEDDFGVTQLDLIAKRTNAYGTAEGTPWPSARGANEIAGLQAAGSLDVQELSTSLTERLIDLKPVHEQAGTRAAAEYSWDLESLGLAPGDELSYHAVAVDSYPDGGSEHAGRSAPMRIKIISDLEFDMRVRSELAMLEERMRLISLDEAELLDGTSAIADDDDTTTQLRKDQRDTLSTLSMRQGRVIRRVHFLAERFAQLAERMDRNHAGNDDARRQIADVGTELHHLATGPMTRATASLADASRPSPPVDDQPTTETDSEDFAEAQKKCVNNAKGEQELVIATMQHLLRSMSHWGNFQWLVSSTRDLLDRQEVLRRHTLVLGKSLLGRDIESLTSEQHEALNRAKRREEQLLADVEDLLAQMGRLHEDAEGKPPDERSDADSIDAALRAARAGNITKRARSAAEAIGANRTAAAAIEQRAVAKTLRRMVTALRERDRRELASLRKRIESAEEQIAVLIDEETELRQATGEAATLGAENADVVQLENEQHRIKNNTRAAAESIATSRALAGTGEAARTARTVRLAEAQMESALKKLQDGSPSEAPVAQDEALEFLEDALAQLEELARLTAEQEFQRTLEQIRTDLIAIRSAQTDVNEGIGKLLDVNTAGQGSRRSKSREAARLARQQTAARAMLSEVMPDLKKVPVYEWALRRVAEWMETCGNRLDTRRIEGELLTTAVRIVRELDKLIVAIDETKALPSITEFAEAEGGASTGRSSVSAKPVPAIAELLVLKAMQADINTRTTELHQTVDVDTASEGQLRELRVVGEDQAQVRSLTKLVTKRAQHP